MLKNLPNQGPQLRKGIRYNKHDSIHRGQYCDKYNIKHTLSPL